MIKHLRMWALTAGVLAGLCGVLALGGCATGKVQGRVVEGPYPAVMIVDRDDARLQGDATRGEAGVSRAAIEFVLDPGTLRARRVGYDQSNRDGWFTIDVDAFGAGFLEYDVQVYARHAGYAPTIERVRVPSSRKRLLVVMTPGAGGEESSDEHFLDETLRLGEPYMD